MIKEFQSVGIKDMHPMQIKALMDFIDFSFHLAAHFEGEDVIMEVEDRADDLVKLFGGVGVTVSVEDDH
jgi:hypothetical protein